MNIPKVQCGVFLAPVLFLFSAPIAANDSGRPGWTETKDKWGQLIFCQRIYKLPEVKTRLYSFDYEQCEQAGQLIADVVANYSEQEQVQLRNQAEQHAIKLSYNTSEPYHSVAACREYCRDLTEMQEKKDD
jgi:hypothetical protein